MYYDCRQFDDNNNNNNNNNNDNNNNNLILIKQLVFMSISMSAVIFEMAVRILLKIGRCDILTLSKALNLPSLRALVACLTGIHLYTYNARINHIFTSFIHFREESGDCVSFIDPGSAVS